MAERGRRGWRRGGDVVPGLGWDLAEVAGLGGGWGVRE